MRKNTPIPPTITPDGNGEKKIKFGEQYIGFYSNTLKVQK